MNLYENFKKSCKRAKNNTVSFKWSPGFLKLG